MSKIISKYLCNIPVTFKVSISVLTSGTVGAFRDCGQFGGVGVSPLGTLLGLCGLDRTEVASRTLIRICSLIGGS